MRCALLHHDRFVDGDGRLGYRDTGSKGNYAKSSGD
ncbi:hypothetical protein J2S64_003381 [Paeniglutamicibacter sulfureus]|uniref:Uncharacterized protein n=1 Tax=Paeniglutamicibacter sulfureus TaxID=43666 RepID=A0ABU2BM07_9MICC|nr:hypothetical protein [Paeniglutamicibacter sulfureus]